MVSRREFMWWMAALGAPLAAGRTLAASSFHVVVVGGGFGGAGCARYLKQFAPGIQVTLVEPNAEFIMCPMSSRVVAGRLRLKDLSRPYDNFTAKYGIRWVKGFAEAIDAERREVSVGGQKIRYDRLVVAPGVDFAYENIPGLQTAEDQARAPHAWKAGEQTLRLRNLLANMPENGVFALHIPPAPFRCPPGPYERASLIAHYVQLFKPRGKVLVFDSNPQILAKKDLFEAVWKQRYGGIIQYVPNATLNRVDTRAGILDFAQQGTVRADVISVIPPQRAGALAVRAGLATAENRWCGVNFLNYESQAIPGIHVLGDSIASAGLPKSGHMANQEAKVCAAFLAAQSLGIEPPKDPIIANTCYSFVSQTEAIHVAGVFRYDAGKKVMAPVKGAGGLSETPSTLEALHAMAWATNILDDTLS